MKSSWLNSKDQRLIYNKIITDIADDKQNLSFIDGKAGSGKTFLVNAICDTLRLHDLIVLPTASSAFAAQLYPGGKTTHSTLKVRPYIQPPPVPLR